MNPEYARIFREGLWSSNQGLVALLGLCPLLAVTNSAVNGLGLGLATMAVLLMSNATVSLIRGFLRPEIRLPIFVLVIAAFVTAVELVMNAWFHDLYKVLGIFIPLIVTNCSIIGRAEAFASKNPLLPSLADGLAMGLGFTGVLLVLGSAREIIGMGSWFDQAALMFGESAAALTMHLGGDYEGALLAVLPPGAFIGLGLLIVLKNLIDQRAAARREALEPSSLEQAEMAG